MRFSGPVVILASGPSLTDADIEATKHLPCVAINTTWEKVRHCQVLFAGDHRWWCDNAEQIDIPAIRVSLSSNSERQYSATRFKTKVSVNAGYNSGAVAIEYAIVNGAERIILLGMDCSVKLGEHHHGKHPKSPNPNETKCALWKQQFRTLRKTYPSADIVNCSRYTELDMFPCMPLEEALR
jgi:hypothetical protein